MAHHEAYSFIVKGYIFVYGSQIYHGKLKSIFRDMYMKIFWGGKTHYCFKSVGKTKHE